MNGHDDKCSHCYFQGNGDVMTSCRKPERGHTDGRGLALHQLQLLTLRKAWHPSRSASSVIPRAALPSLKGPATSRATVTLATVLRPL